MCCTGPSDGITAAWLLVGHMGTAPVLHRALHTVLSVVGVCEHLTVYCRRPMERAVNDVMAWHGLVVMARLLETAC